jgi:rod shape determining protein RodA
MFDRRLIQYFDWVLLGLIIVISLIGTLTLYSAVTAGYTSPQKILYTKQLIWYGVGLIGMITAFLFNYKTLERWAHAIYVACVILLLVVLVFGTFGGGSKRWLVLGPVSIQPSEIVKLALIIVLARYYSKVATIRGLTLRDLVQPVILTLIPFALIVKQPDLGTAMLLLLIVGSVTVFVKIERRSMAYIILSGLIAVPLVWFSLKGYQKQRIMTFLDPDRDPLGAGYHIIQSKIAIGSGMLTGKGFLKGTQNALAFLPEQHTDFIFSVLAEEWGFAGALIMLLLMLLLVVWGLRIAHGCRDTFGTILAAGITAMIFWQVFINIGMVMGLMPVVGVPLPFISYGGSSVVTMMISVGVLMGISMRRFMFE